MKNIEVKVSADGSSTLYRPDLNEHYHSMNGAVQESLHVFIDAGLKMVCKNDIHILEIGFGTGLNALLTLTHKAERVIHYHTLEKFPVPNDLLAVINYPSVVPHPSAGEWFGQIHTADWNREVKIANGFYLTKMEADLLMFSVDSTYDLVYFDAFAPEKQPEMWSESVFQMLFKAMRNGAILTTYCAKGVVRRFMQSAGFKVERLQGPPGKREMLRAMKV
ncbi:tRNA (5-methylaminomethyl-2-thiouridine)(34)-methyltransferase MnmD [Alkaliflexus imshenetskii]|uniref:tRNA (5-methylaminomethyl-2-thiouridine)(34)-methyltransferase MnmD n=1 Tax=Alkaliflexus imshenetskii TaxID=286730 RepID=UPI00047A8FF3|nr:tRNA (5-methylaminomethyl-2-thiouridine)(34)-methyltransferase MnmD [Alkaliflexus imshenetskii]